MTHYNGDIKQVSFDNLIFKDPFIETGGRSKKTVFFSGVDGKPGVTVAEFVDRYGNKKYSFHSAAFSLYRVAQSTYAVLTKQGCHNIKFALILCPKRHQRMLLKKLKNEFLGRPVKDHFQKLQPWLSGENKLPPPLSLFSFERPYILDEDGVKQWNFSPFHQRVGVYIFLENNLRKGETVIANVGMSTVLRKRILFKFFPNRYLYYRDQPGELEYSVAVIDIPKSLFKTRERLQQKAIEIEDLLIKLLNPRDNKKGKIEIDMTNAWRPVPDAVEF